MKMAKMMEVVLRDEIYRFFFLMNMMVKLMVTMAVEKMVMRAVKEDGEGDKGCKEGENLPLLLYLGEDCCPRLFHLLSPLVCLPMP